MFNVQTKMEKNFIVNLSSVANHQFSSLERGEHQAKEQKPYAYRTKPTTEGQEGEWI